MRDAVKGVAVRGINIGDVRALQVPLPSRPEQDEIVRRIDVLLGYGDRLMEMARHAHSQVERLTPSTLTKAFRGDLVPQDPNDEPASELLARLKNRRPATAIRPPRMRRKSSRRKPTMRNAGNEELRAAILKLKVSAFSFEDLQSHVGGDYESLKDALFELLEESEPIVRQVFDKKTKAMRFIRVTP
jgi:type I restriction enzyme S subunit